MREDISISTGDSALNRCLERTYDNFGRPIGYQLKNGDQVEQALSYTYNTAGQVSRITADGKQFDYQYVEKAPSLISGMSSPVHTVSNTYDEKQSTLSNKTNSWKNKIDSPTISSYTYTVNSFGQRTSVSTEGEAFANAPAPWAWNYDVLGQVIKANNNSYVYDSIGNRKTFGKDNEVLENYQANSLNQYSSVGNIAPAYDNEGNLLSGLSKTATLPNRDTLLFSYNNMNRPISVSRNGEVLESYEYDHMGRRVKKGNTITIYDGYNAIAEYNLNSKSLKETYTWGLDLSGSIQNAGGVGGLLSVTDYSTQTPLVSYPTYDGNGNISEYLTEQSSSASSGNSSSGTQELGLITAHYEYDAFGNVIKKTGDKNYTYQFSTKPFDTLTGLNYYNYRLYDSTNGRWINRDPIEEQGGLNLYAFVGNNGVNKWDVLGFLNSGNSVFLSVYSPYKITTMKELAEWHWTSHIKAPISAIVVHFVQDLKYRVKTEAVGKCDKNCNPSIENESHLLKDIYSASVGASYNDIGYEIKAQAYISNTRTIEQRGRHPNTLIVSYKHSIAINVKYAFFFGLERIVEDGSRDTQLTISCE